MVAANVTGTGFRPGQQMVLTACWNRAVHPTYAWYHQIAHVHANHYGTLPAPTVVPTFDMLVTIGLVYRIIVILVRLRLVPVVIFFALRLSVFGAFVSLAATGRALDLSALIGLQMLASPSSAAHISPRPWVVGSTDVDVGAPARTLATAAVHAESSDLASMYSAK
jgi:hypothetical protein